MVIYRELIMEGTERHLRHSCHDEWNALLPMPNMISLLYFYTTQSTKSHYRRIFHFSNADILIALLFARFSFIYIDVVPLLSLRLSWNVTIYWIERRYVSSFSFLERILISRVLARDERHIKLSIAYCYLNDDSVWIAASINEDVIIFEATSKLFSSAS